MAKLPHSYITLAAAAKPHHACKIKFLEDYYPHVLVTYTRLSVTSIFNTIQQLLPKLKTWTTWPTIWIAMGQATVTAFTTVRTRCAWSRTNWDTCVNHVSDRAKRPKHCLAPNPHGHGVRPWRRSTLIVLAFYALLSNVRLNFSQSRQTGSQMKA